MKHHRLLVLQNKDWFLALPKIKFTNLFCSNGKKKSLWNFERQAKINLECLSKKRFLGALKGTFFLGKWCRVATYLFIFLIKKKKKKLNTRHMTELFHSYWLNKKKKYMFDKLNITWLWVLVTNYQIITWLFVLVTIYPK